MVARVRQIETEAAPIRYVAELVGADIDSKRAIRWLIALMVLCCGPARHCADGRGVGTVALIRARALRTKKPPGLIPTTLNR